MSLAEQAACWIDKNVIRCVEISEINTKPPGDCASADDIERALHTYLYETDTMPNNRKEEMKRLLENNGREYSPRKTFFKTYIVPGSWPTVIKTGKKSTLRSVAAVQFYTLAPHLRTVDVLAGSTSGAAAGPEVPAVVQEAADAAATAAVAAFAAVTALPVSTLPPIPNGFTSDPELDECLDGLLCPDVPIDVFAPTPDTSTTATVAPPSPPATPPRKAAPETTKDIEIDPRYARARESIGRRATVCASGYPIEATRFPPQHHRRRAECRGRRSPPRLGIC